MFRGISPALACAAGLLTGAGAPAPASNTQTLAPAVVRHIADVLEKAARRRTAWAASHPGQALTEGPRPTVFDVSVMTPTINVQKPPATPAIRFSFTAGPAGLLGANFTFVSPSGQQTISLDYYTTTAPTSGAVDKLQYPVVVNQYAEPGVYTLEEIDTTGNGTETGMYTGPALSSMASTLSFTVVNTGRPDTTPPVAAAARIVTGTVNLASARPVFLVDLTVADDLSGVAFTNITVTGPTGNTFVAGNDTSAPVVKSATLQIGGNLGGLGQPTGTYSVTEVDLTDVAGNTTTINDPAALSKLFGGAATFQVKD